MWLGTARPKRSWSSSTKGKRGATDRCGGVKPDRSTAEHAIAALLSEFVEFGDLLGGEDGFDLIFHLLEFRLGVGFDSIHQGSNTFVGVTNDGFDLAPLFGVQTEVPFHAVAEFFQMSFTAFAGAAFAGWAVTRGTVAGSRRPVALRRVGRVGGARPSCWIG